MTNSPKGSAPRSRCSEPQATRWRFHKYFVGDDQVHREIVESVNTVVRNASKARDQVAMVIATMRLCEEGRLPTGDDLKDELEPSRTQNGLWELKWKRRRGAAAEFRMYHAEPREGEPDMVALHFHVKDERGSADDIDAAQDREMELAATRYGDTDACRVRWGHVRQRCPHCITVA